MTIDRRALLAAGAAWLLCAAAPASSRRRRTLVLTGGTVLDPASGAARIASVVISDGRIAEVGADPRPLRQAQVIDAHGKFLLPGLWDMHAHVAALNAVGHKPESYVGHGVLGVRDMGGHLDQLLALRAEIAGGRTGPELLIAGPTLNGQAFADFHRVVATPEAGRAAVRELKRAGVDLIKVHRATGREVFPAILDEARRARLPVAGHVPLGITWIEAADAGLHSIEHIQTLVENVVADRANPATDIPAAVARIDGAEGDAIFAALVRNRTFFDPTLISYEKSIDNASADLAARRRRLYQWLKRTVGRAGAAGVTMLTGTDLVERPGHGLHEELARLVESGLSTTQVLRAATANSAAAAGRPAAGRIAPGSPASLLVVDADPREDIGNLRRLSAVVLRGRVVGTGELARLRALGAADQEPRNESSRRTPGSTNVAL